MDSCFFNSFVRLYEYVFNYLLNKKKFKEHTCFYVAELRPSYVNTYYEICMPCGTWTIVMNVLTPYSFKSGMYYPRIEDKSEITAFVSECETGGPIGQKHH